MDYDVNAQLAKLRVPFDKKYISKLPKPTQFQTNEVKKSFKAGIRCNICGGWHHPKVVHLDYVGHAALTDRLLEVDIMWNWEPVATDDSGAPALTVEGGMWIKLTICGLTRLGYGNADGKKGGDGVKEIIGDAIRNGAMRFGAALDQWSKADLTGNYPNEPSEGLQPKGQNMTVEQIKEKVTKIVGSGAGVTALEDWIDSTEGSFSHLNATDLSSVTRFIGEVVRSVQSKEASTSNNKTPGDKQETVERIKDGIDWFGEKGKKSSEMIKWGNEKISGLTSRSDKEEAGKYLDEAIRTLERPTKGTVPMEVNV